MFIAKNISLIFSSSLRIPVFFENFFFNKSPFIDFSYLYVLNKVRLILFYSCYIFIFNFNTFMGEHSISTSNKNITVKFVNFYIFWYRNCHFNYFNANNIIKSFDLFFYYIFRKYSCIFNLYYNTNIIFFLKYFYNISANFIKLNFSFKIVRFYSNFFYNFNKTFIIVYFFRYFLNHYVDRLIYHISIYISNWRTVRWRWRKRANSPTFIGAHIWRLNNPINLWRYWVLLSHHWYFIVRFFRWPRIKFRFFYKYFKKQPFFVYYDQYFSIDFLENWLENVTTNFGLVLNCFL